MSETGWGYIAAAKLNEIMAASAIGAYCALPSAVVERPSIR